MPTRQGGVDLHRLSTGRDTSGKYANADSPQWMRTLEEKYQKLHTKIQLSTRLNSIRTQRSRLQVLRNGGLFKQSNITSARAKICSTVDNTDNSEKTEENKVSENVNIKSGDMPDAVTDLPVPDTVHIIGDAKVEERSTAFKKETTFLSEEHITKGPIHSTSMPSLNKNSTDLKVLSRHLPNGISRKVNMPTSRESHYTPRSCPAMIETLKKMGTPRLSKTGSSRRGLRGFRSLNMFSKMSSEAQHAVSETLMEMGVERSSSVSTESSSVVDQVDAVPSPEPLIEEHCTNVNSRFPQTYSACNRFRTGRRESQQECSNVSACNRFTAGRRECQQVGSNVSACSSDFPEPPHFRLPHLLRRSTPHVYETCHIQNLDRARLRIPGVGKYDVAMFREPTFQITPPDFDIRYRDVLSFEHYNADPPPEEIKSQAIAKCQAWLTKYSAS